MFRQKFEVTSSGSCVFSSAAKLSQISIAMAPLSAEWMEPSRERETIDSVRRMLRGQTKLNSTFVQRVTRRPYDVFR